jgi:hypothetical protein
MSELQNPIVEWRLAQSPEAALIILLHGWGDMLERCRDLPSTLYPCAISGRRPFRLVRCREIARGD